MCRDHGLEPCTVPRCQVLALCAAELPRETWNKAQWDSWRAWADRCRYGRPETWQWPFTTGRYADEMGRARHELAHRIADRLVAWTRWRGERRAGACARSWFTATHMLGVRPGIDDHWEDHGPGFFYPLDELLPYRERIRTLASACPVCRGSGWHPVYGPVQHELQAGGSYQPTPEGIAFRALHLPCEHDGIDWATVLVFLDWLVDRGWTLQDVHEWRPPAIGA